MLSCDSGIEKAEPKNNRWNSNFTKVILLAQSKILGPLFSSVTKSWLGDTWPTNATAESFRRPPTPRRDIKMALVDTATVVENIHPGERERVDRVIRSTMKTT